MEFSSFLDSRFRGNDTLSLARQGRGELLHSAKVLQLSLSAAQREGTSPDLSGIPFCEARNILG